VALPVLVVVVLTLTEYECPQHTVLESFPALELRTQARWHCRGHERVPLLLVLEHLGRRAVPRTVDCGHLPPGPSPPRVALGDGSQSIERSFGRVDCLCRLGALDEAARAGDEAGDAERAIDLRATRAVLGGLHR